jgi:hypothetical protein
MFNRLFILLNETAPRVRRKHALREPDKFANRYDPALPFFMQKTLY